MAENFSNFIFLYLLFPIMGMILGVVMFFIAKKNRLLNNRKTVFYFLICILTLSIPASLGYFGYWFMPSIYIGLGILYFILGYFNIKIMNRVIDGLEEKAYWIQLLFVFIIFIVSSAVFSLIFNLCSELQYGLWASTCLVSLPFASLFLKAYQNYLEIPAEVYFTWNYEKENQQIEKKYFDNNKIIVVELELFKKVTDKQALNIRAKASDNIPFGLWFKLFIDDYNKKSPLQPIIYSEVEQTCEWIFYTSSFLPGRKKHINPHLSFQENKIKEKNCIIAKRVQQENQNL